VGLKIKGRKRVPEKGVVLLERVPLASSELLESREKRPGEGAVDTGKAFKTASEKEGSWGYLPCRAYLRFFDAVAPAGKARGNGQSRKGPLWRPLYRGSVSDAVDRAENRAQVADVQQGVVRGGKQLNGVGLARPCRGIRAANSKAP